MTKTTIRITHYSEPSGSYPYFQTDVDYQIIESGKTLDTPTERITTDADTIRGDGWDDHRLRKVIVGGMEGMYPDADVELDI